MHRERRSLVLLALGALGGLVLAVGRLVWHPAAAGAFGPEVVAVVNDVPITRQDLEAATAAVAADRRGGLAAGDRRRMLDRLIDEELLLQRALELDLERREPRIRGALVSAVVDAALADAARGEPSDETLRGFYDRHPEYFVQAGRLRIVHRIVPGVNPTSRARALEIVEALGAGQAVAADDAAAEAPEALLPVAKLQQYLGPTVLRTALELPVGGVSQPIASLGGYHVVQVLEREPDATPPFDEIRESVRAELERRRGDEALHAYLDELRRDAGVTVLEPGQ